VYDFQIPVAHGLPTFWGVSIGQARGVYGTGWSNRDEGDWGFADLLLSHRLPASSSIYSSTWQPFAANASNLRALWARGQRWLNLGGLSGCQHCEGPAATPTCNLSAFPPTRRCCDAKHEVSCNDDCFKPGLAEIATAYAQAITAGWPANHTTVYLIDETSSINCYFCVPAMAAAARRAAPGAQTIVVGDNAWSLASAEAFGPGGSLCDADFLFPHPAVLAQTDPAVRAAADAAGKMVGYYNSDDCEDVFALSVLAETAAVRARLLLGIANWKMQVGGFLLWSLNDWRQVYFDAYTAKGSGLWVGRSMSSSLDLYDFRARDGHDGEGTSVLPGPPHSRYKGILSTLQLENVRDGLEDWECYALLQGLVAEARARGLTKAADEAQSALAIPSVVLDATLDDVKLTGVGGGSHDSTSGAFPGPPLAARPTRRLYTEDPAVVRAQWRTVARAIVKLQALLGRHTATRALKHDDTRLRICVDELGCSLNGACSQGHCVCYPPWSGPTCGELDRLPATPKPAFGSDPNISSWGGNAVQDDDGVWHLFVANMANGCGMRRWTSNSFVTHAVSSTPVGPYKRQGVALPVFAHNPQVVRFNASLWALFTIATKNATAKDCGPAPTEDAQTHGDGEAFFGTFLHVANGPAGPWTGVTHTPAPGCTNPSPFVREGVWYLACHTGWHNGTSCKVEGARCTRVFRAPDLNTPWTQLAVLPTNPPGTGAWEDP
jgi:hypothetical protein